MVASTQKANERAWARWKHFCNTLNIDESLAGVAGAEVYLEVFAYRVRKGDYSSGKSVRVGSVAQHISAISKELSRMVAAAEQLKPGTYPTGIKELLRTFSREDPPPQRAWPVTARILEELLAMPRPKEFDELHWNAIQDLCLIGYFFLLRPVEFSHTGPGDTQTIPFQLRHVYFLQGLDHLDQAAVPTRDCNDSNTQYAGLMFDDQKNAKKGERITHQQTGSALCPVKALKRRLQQLLGRAHLPTTPIYMYYNNSKSMLKPVTSNDITTALRKAASRCYQSTGIPSHEVSARSLRPGGATALLCANIDKDTIKLLGRWRSDAVDTYLRTNAYTMSADYASHMVTSGNYKFSADQATKEYGFPDLLPDSANDEIQDKYISTIHLEPDELLQMADQGTPPVALAAATLI